MLAVVRIVEIPQAGIDLVTISYVRKYIHTEVKRSLRHYKDWDN